jgi:hypothetical protein
MLNSFELAPQLVPRYRYIKSTLQMCGRPRWITRNDRALSTVID